MLQKSARPGYKRVIKKTALVLLAAEAIAFGVSYAGWYRLNTDREFRHYVKDNYPTILEGYYQVGEVFSKDNTIRNVDEQIWAQERASSVGGSSKP